MSDDGTRIAHMRFKRHDGEIIERFPVRVGLEFQPREPVAWDGKHVQKAIPGKFDNIIGQWLMRDVTYLDHAWVAVGFEGD